MFKFRMSGLLEQQPFVAAMTSAVGAAVIVWAWLSTPLSTLSHQRDTLLVAPFLIASYVVAQRFPVHVASRTKVIMGSVALYLLAVLLPVAAAVTAIVGAKAIMECSARRTRGLHALDIVTSVARWAPIAALGSYVAHASLGSLPLHSIPYVLAAGVFLAGDILTTPLILAPIVHQSPARIIAMIVRAVAPVEAGLYLIGILGAIVAQQEPWALSLLVLPTALVYVAFKRAREMQQSTRQILEGMADTVDLRDPYTGGHSRRVAELVSGILRQVGIQGPDYELIVSAARVHDIGKIGIPDAILNKTEALSPDEMRVMQLHAEQGAELLMRFPDFSRGVQIIRHHHESWDGTGYPHRLAGTAIPYGARVIAVADAWDAMTNDRPYRKALAPERAAAILRDGRGINWDPELVDAFLRSIDQLLAVPAPAPHLRIVSDEVEKTVTTA